VECRGTVAYNWQRNRRIGFCGSGQDNRTPRRRPTSIPFPDGTVGRRVKHAETCDATRRTAVRPVPRRLQPQQSAVPVRRRWPAGGRAGVRHGHRAVRVASARLVLFPVHEHGPSDSGRSLGRAVGRVLRNAGRYRRRRPGAGSRPTGRRNERARFLRIGTRIVLPAHHVGGTETCLTDGVRRYDRLRGEGSSVDVWWRTGHRWGGRHRSTLFGHDVRRKVTTLPIRVCGQNDTSYYGFRVSSFFTHIIISLFYPYPIMTLFWYSVHWCFMVGIICIFLFYFILFHIFLYLYVNVVISYMIMYHHIILLLITNKENEYLILFLLHAFKLVILPNRNILSQPMV